MKQTKISFNLDGLEDIKKQVGNTYRTRVGIIGNKAAQNHLLENRGYKENRTHKTSTISNSELGLIQMFGSITNGIPPRDFLLMPLITKHREIIQAFGSGSIRDAFARGDYKKMFVLLGIKAEEIVQNAFETGGFGQWAPNETATINRKGSSSPLIDTGQLRRAVTSDVVSNSSTPQVGNNPRVQP